MSFKKCIINIVDFFCYFCCIKCLHILVEVLLHFSRKFSRHENKIGMIFTLNRLCFGKQRIKNKVILEYTEKVTDRYTLESCSGIFIVNLEHILNLYLVLLLLTLKK